MEELVKAFPAKSDLMSKYRTLILGLTKSNPELKLHIIKGSITPAKFANMSEMDLASAELVAELKEKEAF
jgi:hypothetical protein